jgi:hypothetical protein
MSGVTKECGILKLNVHISRTFHFEGITQCKTLAINFSPPMIVKYHMKNMKKKEATNFDK